MQTQCILSVTSNDKPGVVEALASAIENAGGNWLESKLAHLSGKFVGVIRVAVATEKKAQLCDNVSLLTAQGISVVCEDAENQDPSRVCLSAKFSVVGPDRPGIVKEIATAFNLHGINVEELESNVSSMAYSGDPMFEAYGQLSLPTSVDLKDLYAKLEDIANELGVDLDVDPINDSDS